MKTFATLIAAGGALLIGQSIASAADTTIYPGNSTTDTAAPLGLVGDGAPGFGADSFQANGTDKTAIILSADRLFGTGSSVTLGDLESLSYWTKKTTASTEVDWYIEIYTKADSTDDDDWYGRRINAEPYFSASSNAPADQWNQWSSEAGDNQLRFFDANRGASGSVYGTHDDPFLSALTDGEVNWKDYNAAYADAAVDYRDEEIWFIGISTGSGWADGFTGQVDGFSVAWDTGSGVESSTVNFEVPEPASLALLSAGGLLMLKRRRA